MQLLKLFLIFFKIGAFTLGGGYAMIPLIQTEVVDRNRWLSNEEFLDAIAISQSSPGAIAVNISIFIGYKLAGYLGALACVLGVVLPSFLIILIISVFFYQFRNNKIIDKVFLGIRPAVVGLIFSSVYKLTIASKINVKGIVIAVVALALIVIDVNPIIVILGGGIGAIVYYKFLLK